MTCQGISSAQAASWECLSALVETARSAGVLRLRICFAQRSRYFAQDDNSNRDSKKGATALDSLVSQPGFERATRQRSKWAVQLQVMSYDLYFCRERQEYIDFGGICSWAEEVGSFKRSDNQLWYQNEDTGVYFSLDFTAEQSPEAEGPEIPPGYFDTGLSFNLNFNRPSFFGHEAMPIVENLAEKFGLFAFDPQAHDSEGVLQLNVKADHLLKSWLRSNRNAILAMIEHAGLSTPPQLLIEKSMYKWNYSKEKKNLQRKCGEAIFVPTLSPVRRIGSNAVELAFVCTQGVPCLVPTSDWVFIVRDRKAHFWSGKQSEIGVVSVGQFQGLVADRLEPFNSDLSLRLLPPKRTHDISSLLQSCEFEFPREEFEVLALDEFVDIELDSGTAPN